MTRLRLFGERGAVSTELAVLTPVLIGFMLFAVFAGRVAEAEGDVANAAHEAARAASLTTTPDAATAAAETTAAANVDRTVRCTRLDVAVDTGQLVPGGQITVTVTCHATWSDIALVGVPGERTFTASAVEVVDRHRGLGGDA